MQQLNIEKPGLKVKKDTHVEKKKHITCEKIIKKEKNSTDQIYCARCSKFHDRDLHMVKKPDVKSKQIMKLDSDTK